MDNRRFVDEETITIVHKDDDDDDYNTPKYKQGRLDIIYGTWCYTSNINSTLKTKSKTR